MNKLEKAIAALGSALLVAAWGWLFLSNKGVLVASEVITEDRVGKFTESHTAIVRVSVEARESRHLERRQPGDWVEGTGRVACWPDRNRI